MRSRWRRFATPVTLLVLLGVLAAGLWWGWHRLTAPLKSSSPAPCITQSASVLTASEVTVQVFNGGTAVGRAAQITGQLAGKGFVTQNPSNATGQVPKTTIVGASATDPAVLLVAGFFVDTQIQADGRTNGTVDVLVGDSFAGFNDTAPTQVGVPGGSVCIAQPSSTPSPTP